MSLAIGVDPRIRARRIAVRRAEGRRRLRFLVVAGCLVLLAVGAWALSRSPLLDLDHVRVEGVAGARGADVTEAMALEAGTPLFDLDLGALELSVEELPWVRDAAATRDWPGTLRVDVEERRPVAVAVATGGGAVTLDATGVVIGPATPGLDLPRLAAPVAVAPGQVAEAAAPALAVATVIPVDLRPWVDAVTVAPPGADGRAVVGLDLVGGAAVHLGGLDHLEDKIEAVRAALGRTDLRCLREIDVTVPDLITATRDTACDGPIGAEGG